MGWRDFLLTAQRNPHEFLSLNLLAEFQTNGGILEPGQLLNVYPPLCTQGSANGVSVKALSALERIRFLADLARQIRNLADGTEVRLVMK
jgi:hypothetical protein